MDYKSVHRHAVLTQGTTCAQAYFWSNLKELSL